MRRGQNVRLERFASVPSLVLARSIVCVVPVARPGPVELKVKVGGGAARLFRHLCLNDRFMLPSRRLYGGEHAPSGLEAVSNQARFLLLHFFFLLVTTATA